MQVASCSTALRMQSSDSKEVPARVPGMKTLPFYLEMSPMTAAAVPMRWCVENSTGIGCAIVGDHDVHEKSFVNFLEAMSERTHYAFTIGSVRFVAMNAFDVPDPGLFVVSEEQLA